jgi:hypothetical protein
MEEKVSYDIIRTEYRENFWVRLEEKRRRQEYKYKARRQLPSPRHETLYDIYAKRLPPPKHETLYDIYAKPTITLKKT